MVYRSTVKKGGAEMERNTELLYWVKFRDLIYYDEKTDTFSYDSKLPERAKKSHEDCLKQIDD